MANQYKNKIIYGNQTLMDITDTTASSNDVLEGEVFYSASGARSIGTLGDATQVTHGLMSVNDKIKLDNINGIQIYKTIDSPTAIATISDGADDLPVKELKVAIEPMQDLHGYDNPWPAGGGKNLLPMTVAGIKALNTTGTWSGNTYSINNITVTILVDNDNNVIGIKLNGTTNAITFFAVTNNIDLQAGTVLNGCPSGGNFSSAYALYLYQGGDTRYKDEGSGISIDTAYTGCGCNIIVRSGVNVSNKTFYPMIHSSSDSSSFVPYSNICPISGWTGSKVTRTGKNLIGLKHSPDRSAYNNGVTVSDETDEHFTLTSNGQSWRYRSLYYPLKAGTYTLSLKATSTTSGFAPVISLYYPTDTPGVSTSTGFDSATQATSSTFTLIEDCVIEFRFFATLGTATTQSATFYDVQLEVGSSATAYEAFKLFAEYDITFPAEAGTVYGGELTINKDGTGTLIIDKKVKDMGTMEWRATSTTSQGIYRMVSDIVRSEVERPTATSVVPQIICSVYKAVSASSSWAKIEGVTIDPDGYVYVYDENYNSSSSASDFTDSVDGQILVYPLATPVSYDITAPQIATLLGMNNIWADTGNVNSIKYITETNGLINSQDKLKLDSLSTVAITGSYTDLLNKPDLSIYLTTVPTMTGATSSAAGTAGLVPIPTSADREKFLRGDGTWQDGGKPMVILSYGNSTWDDFINAYNNNVIVYCRASSNSNPKTGSQTRMAFMAYVNDAANPTNVEFQYYRSVNPTQKSASQMSDQVFIYKLDKTSGWSVTTREASIKEIKAATNSKIGVSWSGDIVTLSNTMTADDMPMSSSDATTTKAAIDTINTKLGSTTMGTTATTLTGAIAEHESDISSLNSKIANLEKNVIGNGIDITGYSTVDNKYTVPKDGYVYLAANGSVGNYVSLKHGNNNTLAQLVVPVQNYGNTISIFVKSGTKVYIEKSTSAYCQAYFTPLN